ncbi:sugar transferase [Indiicoccus explosivorum]|uniref:sugar transferase n=1 Tax=Indiicoccus explosivorum TaxID=1917864 RepID=UPI000B44386D|nr:sugar transferase [Indiicoccus explosivorum]
MRKFQLIVKRVIDSVAALSVLALLSPVLTVIMFWIKVTSEGPVLFKQKRPGLHGAIFEVYKFRTMRIGSEKMTKGQEVMLEDDRITFIGRYLRRFKIDELPQLINVLKGQMSLVGPRPQRIEYLNDYTEEEKKRFDMLPGLTGLAQVSGNIFLTVEQRNKKDIEYVENFSLLLDTKIILKTFGVILFGEQKYIKQTQG